MELKMNSFYSQLKPLLSRLLKEDVGLVSNDDIIISDLSTGRPCVEYCTPLTRNSNVADRFKLKIPYASKFLTWDIIFNSLSPEDPPDFNLNDDDFVRVIDVECLEQVVPSLNSWKYDDANSLKNVISEFIALYKKYQLDQLKEDDFCWFEYVSVLKTGLVNEANFEVLVTNNGLVHFLIRFFPDLMDYEVPRTNECIEQYAVFVTVSFSTSDKMTKPNIAYSPLLQDCLISNSLIINDDSLTLADYLIRLNEKIDDSLSFQLLKPVNKRKRFVFEWLSHFGKQVIEFDALEFHHVSFLLDCDNFCYILLIELPDDFTTSPPEYKFQSVYSQSPLTIPIVNIPYNPNWVYRIMVSKAIGFIKTKIDNFKKICIENM